MSRHTLFSGLCLTVNTLAKHHARRAVVEGRIGEDAYNRYLNILQSAERSGKLPMYVQYNAKTGEIVGWSDCMHMNFMMEEMLRKRYERVWRVPVPGWMADVGKWRDLQAWIDRNPRWDELNEPKGIYDE